MQRWVRNTFQENSQLDGKLYVVWTVARDWTGKNYCIREMDNSCLMIVMYWRMEKKEAKGPCIGACNCPGNTSSGVCRITENMKFAKVMVPQRQTFPLSAIIYALLKSQYSVLSAAWLHVYRKREGLNHISHAGKDDKTIWVATASHKNMTIGTFSSNCTLLEDVSEIYAYQWHN